MNTTLTEGMHCDGCAQPSLEEAVAHAGYTAW